LDVAILSATEAINETATGRFLANMLASTAQYDNDLRSQRVKEGMFKCAESGRFPHIVPLGYLNFTQPDGTKTIILDPQKAEWVKYLLTEFSKGIYLAEELRKKINKLGLHSRKGKPMSAQLVNKILNNKFYYGAISYAGKEFMGNHPKLIDEATYYKNQQLLRKNHSKGDAEANARNSEFFILRHLVICGFCGRPLTACWSVGKLGVRYPYYRCYRKDCPSKQRNIAKAKLEEAFIKYLEDAQTGTAERF